MNLEYIQAILPALLKGTWQTLQVFFLTLVLSLPLGLPFALGSISRFFPVRFLSKAYIWVFRGTPLMVQLMFIFYGLPMIGVKIPEISWIPNFSRFAAGIIAMSMNSCAYVAEVIRSGIQAVDYGQTEAARSVGFSSGEAMRLVVLPQAIKNILPALGNEVVTMVKESSICSTLGMVELMFAAKTVATSTYISLAPYVLAALMYFCITYPAGKAIEALERRMRRGDKH